ncbi:MAG: transposase [Oscillospiraceae bacterium]|nr:transposase [Oscillospiraceae bacterium]
MERVFADTKEKHAMRYILYRGLSQNKKWVRLKFAARNFKKFAKHRWNDLHSSLFTFWISLFSLFLFYLHKFVPASLSKAGTFLTG